MEITEIKKHIKNENTSSICDRANEIAASGDYNQSISLLSTALELSPFDKALRHTRGRKYIGALEFEASIADLSLSSLMLEGDWEPRYYLAVSYFLSGQYEKARHYHIESMALMKKNGIEALPAVVDWIWMSSMRIGDVEFANEILAEVDETTASEDGDYKARVLLYKGLISPDNFVEKMMEYDHEKDRVDIFRLMLMYGLSNYYRYVEVDLGKANGLCEEILKSPRYHNLFAYIQSGQDLEN